MHASANSIFSGPITRLLSMLWVLMEILSHASAKKQTKRLKSFKFGTFMGRFQVMSWQVTGLREGGGAAGGIEENRVKTMRRGSGRWVAGGGGWGGGRGGAEGMERGGGGRPSDNRRTGLTASS